MSTAFSARILLLMVAVSSPLCCTVAHEAEPDTVHAIEGVTVVGRKGRDIIPGERLSGERLKGLNTVSVADALRFFSGMQVKDYGGVGGIKTVNIRSMGSQHLGIYYDGVELGNAQNGQVDLGQYSMDNVGEVTVYNGQRSGIFQTASDFGSAGTVYIATRRPWFDSGETDHFRAKVKYGASDMLRVSGVWEHRFSERVTSSVTAGVLTSSGKYKFRYRRKNYDGSTAYDTTAVRENGDVQAVRAEANIYGQIRGGSWGAKLYTYHSTRGIPGAIVNNVWRRGERQGDSNTFLQGWWQRNMSDRYSMRILAKLASYRTHYINRDTTTQMVDNRYRQEEFYLSTSHMAEICRGWNVSACYDLRWSHLWSDMSPCYYPTRLHNLFSIATSADLRWVKLQGSMLLNIVDDKLKDGPDPSLLTRWTPAVFVACYPFGTPAFSLRAYAKRSFRMPTFNDLYYADMGNSALRPETATQYNVGVLYERQYRGGMLQSMRLQADAYRNYIDDKITAYPKGQQFRWTMMNLGKVRITGTDISADATLRLPAGIAMTTRLQYTYQDARDVTNRNDSYYNDQIAYIPYHSGSLLLGMKWRRWSANYSFIYTGLRYSQQENILYNRLQPWYTSDLNIMRTLMLGKTQMRVTLEINNLFSQDYDVILNYPMPKRNCAISLDIDM